MVSLSQWNICTNYLVWAKYLDSAMYLDRTKYLCWATSKLKTPVYFGSLRCGAGVTSPEAIYPDAQHIHHQVHLQPPGVLGQAKVGHTTPGGGAIKIDILLRIRKIAVQAQFGGDNSKVGGCQNLVYRSISQEEPRRLKKKLIWRMRLQSLLPK